MHRPGSYSPFQEKNAMKCEVLQCMTYKILVLQKRAHHFIISCLTILTERRVFLCKFSSPTNIHPVKTLTIYHTAGHIQMRCEMLQCRTYKILLQRRAHHFIISCLPTLTERRVFLSLSLVLLQYNQPSGQNIGYQRSKLNFAWKLTT
jgi:hypothetical protein